MRKKYTTQAKLAAKLGVTVDVVGKWIARDKIAARTNKLTGITLVEDIEGKPTKGYKQG